MIKSSNILDYIRFLYLNKYKTEASEEVLQSWKQIPEDQIDVYLQELYQHWHLSLEEAQKMEQKFLNRNAAFPNTKSTDLPYQKPPLEKQNPIQYNPPKKEKAHFSKILVIVLILMLLMVIALLSYQLLNKEENEKFPVPPVSNESAAMQTNKEPSSPENQLPSMAEDPGSVSTQNAMVIKRLFEAEMTRDIETILNQFAPYVERYWAINYPTTEELRGLYEENWGKTKDMRYENIKITQVNDSTIDAAATYSYQDMEKNKAFKKNIVNRYIFNENHQIVQAYSL